MKTLLFTLTLTLLTACGTDSKPEVTVNCQGPCVDAPVTLPQPEAPKEPLPSPLPTVKVEEPVITPTEDKPLLKDHTVQFSFLVTTRDNTGSQFCDGRYKAEMKEGGDPYAWTCNGEPAVFPDGLDGWDVNYGGYWASNSTRIDSVKVTEATFEDLKSNPDCKVSGANLMKCSIQDNFVEVFTRVVMNRDELLPGGTFKAYERVNWKIYFWPDLSAY